MRTKSFSRRLGLLVGSIFLLFGIIECAVSLIGRDSIFFFWFPSLIGGGALVLLGTVKAESHPSRSRVALVIGVVAGTLATAWTILLPILALLLAFLRLTEPGNPRPVDPTAS